MNVTQTIIPAAGLGTRFYPYTHTVAKELLPLLNRPALSYILEEAYKSDIDEACIITSKKKGALAAHLTTPLHISYVEQAEPLGLGHAVWLARSYINNNLFSVMLPDDIITSPTIPALAQLAHCAHQEQTTVIAIQEVPYESVSSYGIVSIKKQLTSSLFELDTVVEKPAPHNAPSRLAIIGRYVLTRDIFPALESITPGARGELQLTDALAHLCAQGKRVLAYKVSGTRYDIGTPIGWLKATFDFAAAHPEYGSELYEHIVTKKPFSAEKIKTKEL